MRHIGGRVGQDKAQQVDRLPELLGAVQGGDGRVLGTNLFGATGSQNRFDGTKRVVPRVKKGLDTEDFHTEGGVAHNTVSILGGNVVAGGKRKVSRDSNAAKEAE